MKTFDGYSKEKFSDTSVLLAGGGSKELSNFIGTLNWDSTNRKLQYKKIGDTNWSDLATFGSNALNSISYLPLTGGAINGNLIVNGNTTFKGSTAYPATVTDGDSNIVFDTLNNIVYAGDVSLLLATFKNGGNIYGLLTAIPNEETGLYYNNYRLLTNLDFTNPRTTNVTSLGDASSYWTGVYSQGFYKNGSSDDYVLLGGGGHKALSDFNNLTNLYWADIPISNTSNTNTNPTFGTTYIGGHLWLNKQDARSSTLGQSLLVFGNKGTLHVVLSSNTGTICINPSTSSYTGLIVLRIGTSVTSEFPGNINAAHFYENSDIRYKKIIRNLLINSNTIANLPLFDFKWIENNNIGTGTSAQAVQKILPNLVSGTDKLTLDYGVLGTIAGITACKELVNLKSEIELLKERIKELEQQLKMINNYGEFNSD